MDWHGGSCSEQYWLDWLSQFTPEEIQRPLSVEGRFPEEYRQILRMFGTWTTAEYALKRYRAGTYIPSGSERSANRVITDKEEVAKAFRELDEKMKQKSGTLLMPKYYEARQRQEDRIMAKKKRQETKERRSREEVLKDVLEACEEQGRLLSERALKKNEWLDFEEIVAVLGRGNPQAALKAVEEAWRGDHPEAKKKPVAILRKEMPKEEPKEELKEEPREEPQEEPEVQPEEEIAPLEVAEEVVEIAEQPLPEVAEEAIAEPTEEVVEMAEATVKTQFGEMPRGKGGPKAKTLDETIQNLIDIQDYFKFERTRMPTGSEVKEYRRFFPKSHVWMTFYQKLGRQENWLAAIEEYLARKGEAVESSAESETQPEPASEPEVAAEPEPIAELEHKLIGVEDGRKVPAELLPEPRLKEPTAEELEEEIKQYEAERERHLDFIREVNNGILQNNTRDVSGAERDSAGEKPDDGGDADDARATEREVARSGEAEPLEINLTLTKLALEAVLNGQKVKLDLSFGAK